RSGDSAVPFFLSGKGSKPNTDDVHGHNEILSLEETPPYPGAVDTDGSGDSLVDSDQPARESPGLDPGAGTQGTGGDFAGPAPHSGRRHQGPHVGHLQHQRQPAEGPGVRRDPGCLGKNAPYDELPNPSSADPAVA